MPSLPKPFATGWKVGKGIRGAGVGALAGGAIGGMTAGEGEDKWRAAKRGAGIGALAGGGIGYYRGRTEVNRANKVLEHYKAPGRIKKFFNRNAERDALEKAVKMAKTSSINPVTMAAFSDEIEKIAYLKSMGIGAGIGAGVGALTGAVADDKNRFRGAIGGALGGAALGAGGGAAVKALRGAKPAAGPKPDVSVNEMIGRARLRRGANTTVGHGEGI